MKKKLLHLAFFLLVATSLVACKGGPEKGQATKLEEDNKIVVGVTAVPHEEIVEALRPQIEGRGIDLEVEVFNDYPIVNKALAEGDLDANFFQHEPYFNDFKEEHKLDLVSLGVVHLEPLGFYSASLTSLEDLAEGAEVLIPNDPTNCGRALILLQDQGLIELKDPEALDQTENDIAVNPKNIKLTAVDAATIAKTYQDVDGAVINSNFAIMEGLKPAQDALAIEATENNPYANLVAVRTGEEASEKFQILMEVLHSDECRSFLEETYEGSVIPAF